RVLPSSPTRRSSDLLTGLDGLQHRGPLVGGERREEIALARLCVGIDVGDAGANELRGRHRELLALLRHALAVGPAQPHAVTLAVDRKSTRLNSSHLG